MAALPAQALVGILAAAVLTAVANVMIRAGIERYGGFSPAGFGDLARQFLELLLQPLFSFGFLLYFLASLVWFRTIAIAPLSTAYPLLVSFTFLAVTGGAVLIWGEPLTSRKLLGLCFILVGIAVVSMASEPG